MTDQKKKQLQKSANHLRKGILTQVYSAASGHPGGSLSIADIMTYLYREELRVDPQNPRWEDRDRLVLSKGHVCPALYAALAMRGFFPEEELVTFRKLGSRLQGHPDLNKCPGVDFTAGSLGQGVSAAVGMALVGKLSKKDYRVYAILGDGEVQEGQVWESAMFAAHNKLDNLCYIIDNNGNVFTVTAGGTAALTVTLYNLQGAAVAAATADAGEVTLDATSLQPGIYVLTITAPHATPVSKKVALH